jgi:hypothetical protein
MFTCSTKKRKGTKKGGLGCFGVPQQGDGSFLHSHTNPVRGPARVHDRPQLLVKHNKIERKPRKVHRRASDREEQEVHVKGGGGEVELCQLNHSHLNVSIPVPTVHPQEPSDA